MTLPLWEYREREAQRCAADYGEPWPPVVYRTGSDEEQRRISQTIREIFHMDRQEDDA